MITITHARSLKVARQKARHATALMGANRFRMVLHGDDITAVNDNAAVFPEWDGLPIVSIGTKFILAIADGEEIPVVPGKDFRIDFEIGGL